MTLILAQRNRKLIRDITLQDADGNTVTPATGDVVRVKIGMRGQTPSLDLDSAQASANGSTITTGATNRVQIVQEDMLLLNPGVYSFEVALVDVSDSNAIKHADNQIMVVQDIQTGDIGVS